MACCHGNNTDSLRRTNQHRDWLVKTSSRPIKLPETQLWMTARLMTWCNNRKVYLHRVNNLLITPDLSVYVCVCVCSYWLKSWVIFTFFPHCSPPVWSCFLSLVLLLCFHLFLVVPQAACCPIDSHASTSVCVCVCVCNRKTLKLYTNTWWIQVTFSPGIKGNKYKIWFFLKKITFFSVWVFSHSDSMFSWQTWQYSQC